MTPLGILPKNKILTEMDAIADAEGKTLSPKFYELIIKQGELLLSMLGKRFNRQNSEFLCPCLPKAGVGHIEFCHDVTSVYVHTCVCHIRNQSLTNVAVYI